MRHLRTRRYGTVGLVLVVLGIVALLFGWTILGVILILLGLAAMFV